MLFEDNHGFDFGDEKFNEIEKKKDDAV